ncbi:DJC11 protein, partial [Ardeotis kori]|nr:DJC11 protein [Ardeotis kori]
QASQEELKAAYRRLCMLYHPDKHRDPELKTQAERLFNLVHQAYEVLSDPQTRGGDDIYGRRGLGGEGWEVREMKRTPAEMGGEFERLQRERGGRRLQQRTNGGGTISVGIDATDLFDRYDEEYEDVPGSSFPQIEINKMHRGGSIEVRRAGGGAARGGGNLSTQNGGGGGSINLALRGGTSAKGWGEGGGLAVTRFYIGGVSGCLDYPCGGAYETFLVSPGGITTNCALQWGGRGIRPGLTGGVARNLDKNTGGYLQWRWGIRGGMNTSIVRDGGASHFTMALQGGRGGPHSFMMVSGGDKFQDEDQTGGKGSLKAGFFGGGVEYGAERKRGGHSILGATVGGGVPQGVSLKGGASQTYFWGGHLTDQLLPGGVFYATVGPLGGYFAMHRLIRGGYLRAQKERGGDKTVELEKQRGGGASDILQKKGGAEAAVRLSSGGSPLVKGSGWGGLIVVNAWGGKFVNDNSRGGEKVKVIDVTGGLQCLVKDSRGGLTEASKSCENPGGDAHSVLLWLGGGLPGFYDPWGGEEKSLKVLGGVRGVLHQVMGGDNEALRIPR